MDTQTTAIRNEEVMMDTIDINAVSTHVLMIPLHHGIKDDLSYFVQFRPIFLPIQQSLLPLVLHKLIVVVVVDTMRGKMTCSIVFDKKKYE